MAEKLAPEELDRHARILNDSRDSASLTASAVALAASEDPDAILLLGRALRRRDFLGRLDDITNPAADIRQLILVFQTLAEHPTEATARVCELLYGEPEFREIPARINLLLSALAAVRPVSAEAAEVFRASNREGFAEVNAPLLVKNESPLALEVFEEMIAGDWLESYVKVDMLHRSVLPSRTRLPVLQACARLLERPLPPDVRAGVIETLFDYQSRVWFGPVRNPPLPPAWNGASGEALDFLIALAARLLAGELEPRLRAAVQTTRNELERIRRERGR